MPEEETITFEFIREVQRSEQKSEQLTKLPDNFYEKVKTYLYQKKSLLKKKKDADLLEIKNIERLIEDIYNRRETKIVTQAILAVRTDILPSNMTEHEKELFNNIVKVLKKSRLFLEEFLERNVKKINNDNEYIRVEFLEESPEFIGIDLKKYGPYNKGDIKKIPKDNAQLFIKAGKAKIFEGE